jgi:hypothetical protein
MIYILTYPHVNNNKTDILSDYWRKLSELIIVSTITINKSKWLHNAGESKDEYNP